jgi:hypothetical protein
VTCFGGSQFPPSPTHVFRVRTIQFSRTEGVALSRRSHFVAPAVQREAHPTRFVFFVNLFFRFRRFVFRTDWDVKSEKTRLFPAALGFAFASSREAVSTPGHRACHQSCEGSVTIFDSLERMAPIRSSSDGSSAS